MDDTRQRGSFGVSVNCKAKEIGKAPMRLDRTCKWESGRGKPTGGHYTSRLSPCELRLISNMHNKPEPDTIARQQLEGKATTSPRQPKREARGSNNAKA